MFCLLLVCLIYSKDNWDFMHFYINELIIFFKYTYINFIGIYKYICVCTIYTLVILFILHVCFIFHKLKGGYFHILVFKLLLRNFFSIYFIYFLFYIQNIS